VEVRWHQGADRERVLHDRQLAGGVPSIELEDHSDAWRKTAGTTFTRTDSFQSRNDRGGGGGGVHDATPVQIR
jgi:hypothetical protein